MLRVLAFLMAFLLLSFPALAEPKPISMPKELLGWWVAGDIRYGIDIRTDEIVYRARKKSKNEEICMKKYKIIRYFPEKRETYLMTAFYCTYQNETLSYTKIADEPIKELFDKTPYQHIRIYDSACNPDQSDWDHFAPDAAWKKMVEKSDKCPDVMFQSNSDQYSRH